MMRALLLAAGAVCAMAVPAAATEWITCGDPAGHVQIGLLASHGGPFTYQRGTLRVGDENWSTWPDVEPGISIMGLESYADDNQLYVKFADDQATAIIADLRVFIVTEGDDTVKGGVLDVPGKGAWVVACEGP
jgi:hypothetical protein